MTTRSKITRLLAAGVALLAWTGLILQFSTALDQSTSVTMALWAMLRFFTITTNFALAVVMTGVALRRPAFGSAALLGGTAIAMGFVGAINATLLGGRLTLGGGTDLTDAIQHYIAPVAALLFWLFRAPKTGLHYGHPLLWVLYPVGYAAYAIGRGTMDGRYPYPFIDLAMLGVWQTGLNVVLLSLTFVLVGLVMVWLSRHLPSEPLSHPATPA